jgi:hypothetical protein
VLGRAADLSAADRLARELWNQRSKEKYGRR